MTTIVPLDSGSSSMVEELLDHARVHDGESWFSEFKMISLRLGAGSTVGLFEAERLVGAGHAAWHHGDGDASSHWAVEVVLDPAHRTREAMQTVISAAADMVPERQRHVLWGWSPLVADAARSLGYVAVRHLSLMQRLLPTGLEPRLPAGVHLVPFRIGDDEQAWLEVNNAAFAGHPENGGLTREDLQLRMQLPWFRSEDLLLAWRGDDVVGSVWTKRHGDGVGEIYVIGVHPDHQGRGLGRALVLAGLDHLATRAGALRGILYVDHRAENAMALYRHLGFTEVRVTTMYVPHETAGRTA